MPVVPIIARDHATVVLPPRPATVTVTLNGRVVRTVQVTLLAPPGALSVVAAEVASWRESTGSKPTESVRSLDVVSVTESGVVVGFPPKIVFGREARASDVTHTSETVGAVRA